MVRADLLKSNESPTSILPNFAENDVIFKFSAKNLEIRFSTPSFSGGMLLTSSL